MTKFQDKTMFFGPPAIQKPKECPHKTFGRIKKGGQWFYLPCMCKVTAQ